MVARRDTMQGVLVLNMELPKQFDNITQRVIDDLKATLQKGSKVSMAAASFSIYAFEALQKELEKIDELRFIFTSPTFNKERSKKQKREFYIPKLYRERTLYGSDFEIKLRNNLTQRAIAKECADWIRRKVRFKTNVSQMNMPGFLNVKNGEGLFTYMPFNEFTTTELGCERGNNIFQLIQRMPSPISDAYLKNFNDFWQDKENFTDVTDAIIENIENVYRENAPDSSTSSRYIISSTSFFPTSAKMYCQTRQQVSSHRKYGTSSIISRRMPPLPSSINWRLTTAASLPTVSV